MYRVNRPVHYTYSVPPERARATAGPRCSTLTGTSSGFTLMEVLVSIVILTMLTFTASMGLSLFLGAWGKDRLSGGNALTDFMHMSLLKDSIGGAYDYFVKLDKVSTERVPYFVTREDGFAFVTTNPLWGHGQSALARVSFRKRGETYDLLYEEASLDTRYLAYHGEPVAYENNMVAATGVRSFAIGYYGAESLRTAGLFLNAEGVFSEEEQKAILAEMDIYNWYPDYNGNVRRMLPRRIKIRLDFGPDDHKEFLFNIPVWTINKPLLFNPEFNIEG